MKQYRHIALGGTFDRIHIGHHHLIDVAANAADKMTIGLTTTKLIQDKTLTDIILNYSSRQSELQQHLKKKGLSDRTKIIPLNDIYGNTLADSSVDSIAVTPQTLQGAHQINKMRSQKGLPKLPIITASLIQDDSGGYISSTKIRQGKINRKGLVYARLFKKTHVLTYKQKKTIKSPQGKLLKTDRSIISQFRSSSPKALIGDIVTQYAIDHKLSFNYAFVDYLSGRKPFKLDLKHWQPNEILKTVNYPGEISQDASACVLHALKKDNILIEVEGEEDLLGFPSVLFLPLDSLVFYGQPQEGVVMIRVTEEAKENLIEILDLI